MGKCSDFELYSAVNKKPVEVTKSLTGLLSGEDVRGGGECPTFQGRNKMSASEAERGNTKMPARYISHISADI